MDNEYLLWYLWTAGVATVSGISSAAVMYWLIQNRIKKLNTKQSIFSDSPEFVVISQATFLGAIKIATSESSSSHEELMTKLEELNYKLLFMQGEIMGIDETLKAPKPF